MNKLPGKTLKFQWPTPIELRCRLRDAMDSDVDAKYLCDYQAKIIATDTDSPRINVVAMVLADNWFDIRRRIYGVNGISPTVPVGGGGNAKIKVIVDE